MSANTEQKEIEELSAKLKDCIDNNKIDEHISIFQTENKIKKKQKAIKID